MQRHVKIKCVNEQCATSGVENVIPATRQVAPGVSERLGALECDWCGHDVSVERVG